MVSYEIQAIDDEAHEEVRLNFTANTPDFSPVFLVTSKLNISQQPFLAAHKASVILCWRLTHSAECSLEHIWSNVLSSGPPKHQYSSGSSGRAIRMLRVLDHLSCEERLGELDFSNLQETKALGKPKSSLPVPARILPRRQSQALYSGAWLQDETAGVS